MNVFGNHLLSVVTVVPTLFAIAIACLNPQAKAKP